MNIAKQLAKIKDDPTHLLPIKRKANLVLDEEVIIKKVKTEDKNHIPFENILQSLTKDLESLYEKYAVHKDEISILTSDPSLLNTQLIWKYMKNFKKKDEINLETIPFLERNFFKDPTLSLIFKSWLGKRKGRDIREGNFKSQVKVSLDFLDFCHEKNEKPNCDVLKQFLDLPKIGKNKKILSWGSGTKRLYGFLLNEFIPPEKRILFHRAQNPLSNFQKVLLTSIPKEVHSQYHKLKSNDDIYGFYLLLKYGGCRISECIFMRRLNLFFLTNTIQNKTTYWIRYMQLKTKKTAARTKVVQIPKKVFDHFRELQPENYLLKYTSTKGLRDAFYRECNKNQISIFHPHSFRNCGALRILNQKTQKGKTKYDLEYEADYFLGHSLRNYRSSSLVYYANLVTPFEKEFNEIASYDLSVNFLITPKQLDLGPRFKGRKNVYCIDEEPSFRGKRLEIPNQISKSLQYESKITEYPYETDYEIEKEEIEIEKTNLIDYFKKNENYFESEDDEIQEEWTMFNGFLLPLGIERTHEYLPVLHYDGNQFTQFESISSFEYRQSLEYITYQDASIQIFLKRFSVLHICSLCYKTGKILLKCGFCLKYYHSKCILNEQIEFVAHVLKLNRIVGLNEKDKWICQRCIDFISPKEKIQINGSFQFFPYPNIQKIETPRVLLNAFPHIFSNPRHFAAPENLKLALKSRGLDFCDDLVYSPGCTFENNIPFSDSSVEVIYYHKFNFLL